MNKELKPSRWRYVPCVFAGLLVAGCVAYFNLALWDYPYFYISWDWGWPLLYRQQGYTLYGGNIPDTLSRDTIYYGALAANIAIGVVMTVLAAWGVNHLQKINRSLFRVHLQTIFLLTLVFGALMFLNAHAREQARANTGVARFYGWPHEAVVWMAEYDWLGDWLNPAWINVCKNSFVALYALFLVTLASESWLAWRARRTKS